MALLTIDDLLNGDKAENLEMLIKAQGFAAGYNQYLVNKDSGASSRAPGIHASEISGCLRKLVYGVNGEERKEEISAIWRKRFMVGHAIHEMLQTDFGKWARSTNFEFHFIDELKIAPHLQPMAAKWNIQSHCDGLFIIRAYPGGPEILRMLLEIKTESPDGFKKLTKPKPEHVEQGHVYMACLDVPLIWFLYWNKGNQNFTGTDDPKYLVQFDPKLWQKLEGRFELAHRHSAMGTLPPKEESIVCDFCAFSGTCQPQRLQMVGRGHKHPPKFARPKK